MSHKICTKCLVKLDINCFRRWSCICKNCQSIRNKEKWAQRKKLLQIPDRVHRIDKIENGVRILNCRCCNQILPEDNFSNNRSNLSGKSNSCKKCKKIADNKDYRKHHEKRRIRNKEYYLTHREQRKEQDKIYREQNKDKLKEYYKQYRLKRSKHYTEQKRLYYQKNKHIINNRTKEKHKTNLHFRLAANLRSRISVAIKGGNKQAGFYKLIGCTTEELKAHLEKQFAPNMNWDNYGKKMNHWHIDHIIPCASFDLTKEEEQRKCFHYSNLRPLWAIENLSKNKYSKSLKQHNHDTIQNN